MQVHSLVDSHIILGEMVPFFFFNCIFKVVYSLWRKVIKMRHEYFEHFRHYNVQDVLVSVHTSNFSIIHVLVDFNKNELTNQS